MTVARDVFRTGRQAAEDHIEDALDMVTEEFRV